MNLTQQNLAMNVPVMVRLLFKQLNLDYIPQNFIIFKEGFEGTDCQIEIKPCTNQLCENGGLCKTYLNGTVECQCEGNFTGQTCEYLKTCSNETCSNNGICADDLSSGGYSCLCNSKLINNFKFHSFKFCDYFFINEGGFTGNFCEKESCFNNLCQNGGICVPRTNSNYTCICPGGFIGPFCEIIDTTVCENVTCSFNGLCSPSSNGSYNCLCSGIYFNQFELGEKNRYYLKMGLLED